MLSAVRCSGAVWLRFSEDSWYLCMLLQCEGPGGVDAGEVSGVTGNGELLPYNSSSSGGVGGRIALLSGGKIGSVETVSCVTGKFWWYCVCATFC